LYVGAGSGQWPICNYRKVVNLFTLTVNASINPFAPSLCKVLEPEGAVKGED